MERNQADIDRRIAEQLAGWAKNPDASSATVRLGDLRALVDEATFWRQDAAARLRTAMALAKSYEQEDAADAAAWVRVVILMPTGAALAGALSGDIYYPHCEGCDEPIKEGDAVYRYEEGEVTHVDCGDPTLGEKTLPPDAERHADDPEFNHAGVAETLAAVAAYLNEDGEG